MSATSRIRHEELTSGTSLSYPLSMASWPNSAAIEVIAPSRERICILPYASLVASNDLNWAFVRYCILSCIVPDHLALDSLSIVNDRNGITVDETVAPTSGTYKLCASDPAMHFVFRRGPVGKRRGRPAASSPATSTLSDSKRSSTNQTKFRWDLVARDSNCLITDEPYWDCTASHIIPYSRPDLYTDLLGYSGEWQFHPWMGLLLEDKISHSFDRYEVSIWPRHLSSLVHHTEDYRDSVVLRKEWVIHVFHDRSGRLRQYHGKTFSVDRFRLPPVTWPREQFLAWHHQQCVMMHYRGFSYAIDADRP